MSKIWLETMISLIAVFLVETKIEYMRVLNSNMFSCMSFKSFDLTVETFMCYWFSLLLQGKDGGG